MCRMHTPWPRFASLSSLFILQTANAGRQIRQEGAPARPITPDEVAFCVGCACFSSRIHSWENPTSHTCDRPTPASLEALLWPRRVRYLTPSDSYSQLPTIPRWVLQASLLQSKTLHGVLVIFLHEVNEPAFSCCRSCWRARLLLLFFFYNCPGHISTVSLTLS